MFIEEVLEGFQASHPQMGLLTAPTPDLSIRSVPLTEASAHFLDNACCRGFKDPFRSGEACTRLICNRGFISVRPTHTKLPQMTGAQEHRDGSLIAVRW